jgi:hypothetical protein
MHRGEIPCNPKLLLIYRIAGEGKYITNAATLLANGSKFHLGKPFQFAKTK